MLEDGQHAVAERLKSHACIDWVDHCGRDTSREEKGKFLLKRILWNSKVLNSTKFKSANLLKRIFGMVDGIPFYSLLV